MNTQEFLNRTRKIKYGEYQECRPRIICNDGFNMSVQAGNGIYSNPRLSGEYNYLSVEIGFPSEEETLINEYAETPNDWTGTVYAYTPIELVDEVIEKHGGINIDKTFKDKEERWKNDLIYLFQ